MRRVPIRAKLAAALALPLGALVAVTALEVGDVSRDVADVREQNNLARSVIGPTGLLINLQNERSWFAIALLGFDDAIVLPVEGYEETRSLTDDAIDAFRAELRQKDPPIRAAFQPALDGLDALDQVRADIDEISAATPSLQERIQFGFDTFDRYTELVEPFFDATTQISRSIDDAQLRQGATLADAVARQIEVISQLMSTTIGNALLTEGGVDQPAEISEAATLRSDLLRYAAEMSEAQGPLADRARERFPTDLTEDLSGQVDLALDTGRIDLGVLLESVNVPSDEGYYGYQDAVHDGINRRASELADAAEARRFRFTLLAGAALAAAVGLTWLVSRSITRPLRSLTRQAQDMAGRRLPAAVLQILDTPIRQDVDVPHIAPVVVRTQDEVADVADALTTVQVSALDLAVEQAVLRRNIADAFVNLGRRNQNLLKRQLDFITQLESRETDADSLSSLFRLDHLATRMRRNAESLLVLGDVEPARKLTAPVRLTEVIRSSIGEVEHYHRVVVGDVEAVTILGAAAADLAHLTAEFVENALSFSPPDHQVEVHGRRRPDTGAFMLLIIDSGSGMPPDELAGANRRLAGTESFTVAPSKHIGHYVAATLAARHGIRLHLEHSPSGGITAIVELPPYLLSAPVLQAAVPDPPVLGGPEGASGPSAAPALASGAAPPGPLATPVSRPGAATPGDAPAPSGLPPSRIQPERTASGLVKRAPRQARASATAPSGTVADSLPGDLLDVLSRHAAAHPPEVSETSADTTSNGLDRRIKGAQMPNAHPLPVQRGGGSVAAVSDRAAGDVYTFLSRFTAGVQRGLDESRHEDEALSSPM